jgi:hypothetical protein
MLFVKPLTINPSDYQVKVGSVRLTSSPSYWGDEIIQCLLRDHPYIPSQRVVVNFKQKDDAKGAAFGYIGILGAPTVSIPIIIKDRELSPLDILIIRKGKDDAVDQGVGDISQDKVIPLNENNFTCALDAGEIGEVVPEAKVNGCGYTEDGTSLRLPFRGRTVLASYVGASDKDKDKLASLLNDKQVLAGFIHNGTDSIIGEWLNADAPKCSVQSKLASAPIELGLAYVHEIPEEKSEFAAANIMVDEATCKLAVKFSTVDLSSPSSSLKSMLLYEDGTYSGCPEKVACSPTTLTEDEILSRVASSVLSKSLIKGATVSFAPELGIEENPLTVPAKIASISTNGSLINVELTNGLTKYVVHLVPTIKTAVFDETTKAWLLPQTSLVYNMGTYVENPISSEKVATYFDKILTDSLISKGGQYTLTVNNDVVIPQCSSEKMAESINNIFANGSDLMKLADAQGLVRFSSTFDNDQKKLASLKEEYNSYASIASAKLSEIKIPLELAVKLASVIGDEDGADAVLSTGFLNEDNVAEFVSLGGEFEAVVEKLARLLLGIRMGFPGDETATVVAMKALQRVVARLSSATQEIA